jgi:hypothetical protein
MYSRKILVGNWFEERYAEQQPERDFPDLRTVRPEETDLCDVTSGHGAHAALTRLKRMYPHISTCTLDDGFRVVESVSQATYVPYTPRSKLAIAPPEAAEAAGFITNETVPEVIHEERRPVKGPASGFGAVLQRHRPETDKRILETSYTATFGAYTPRRAQDRSLRIAAGKAALDYGHHGLRVGELTGEVYKGKADPSVATQVQRAWTDDPAMSFISYGGPKPKPPKTDNALSLPLGEGDMKRQRELLAKRGGKFYLNTTSITTGKGNLYGIHLFQD